MDKSQIKRLAIQCGFTEREQADGSQDLNAYVYKFAHACAAAGREEAARKPHCQLEMTRSLAPADRWHWIVRTPSGHEFAIGASFESADMCLLNAVHDGLAALRRAEDAARSNAEVSGG